MRRSVLSGAPMLALMGVLLLASCVSTAPPRSSSSAPTNPTPVDGPGVAGAAFAALPVGPAQRLLNHLVLSSRAPGAILAVSVAGGSPTVLTSGVADPTMQRPMAAGDSFWLFSVTKTFVAAALLKLVDEHRLNLDDPINTFGVNWPNGQVITVRELLTHTSGIPPLGGDAGWTNRYSAWFDNLLAADPSRSFTPDQILALVRNRPPLSTPGTRTTYSNTNTILAGQVLTGVTGLTLTQALHQLLLGPLDLNHTFFGAGEVLPVQPDPGVYADVAGGSLLATSGDDPTSVVTALGASGAMVSTAGDLVAWGNALLRRPGLLSPAGTALAGRVGPGGTGVGTIGLTPTGPCVFDLSGCPAGSVFTAVGGFGDGLGAAVALVYDPASDSTLAVFVNEYEDADLYPTVLSIEALLDSSRTTKPGSTQTSTTRAEGEPSTTTPRNGAAAS